MELKTIDAPIIVSTRTGLTNFILDFQVMLEEEIVDRIACLEQDSKCIGNNAAKYEYISKTKWRKEILAMVSQIYFRTRKYGSWETKIDTVFDLSTQNAIEKSQNEDNSGDQLPEIEFQDILIRGVCSKAADSRYLISNELIPDNWFRKKVQPNVVQKRDFSLSESARDTGRADRHSHRRDHLGGKDQAERRWGHSY